MIFNLLLCIAIIVIYALTHIKKKRKQANDKKFLIVSFLLLFVLAATREFYIGNDTMGYLNLFEQCKEYGWEIFSINHYYETGFLALNVILGYLNISASFFLGIFALFFSYAVYKFIRDNSKNYLVSTLLYVNLMYFYQSMSMMRQFLALSIILLFGFKFIKEKKIIKYIGVVIAATFFHSTAILAIALYPIFHMKYKRKTVAILCVATIVIAALLANIYPILAQALNRETAYLEMIGETKLGNTISMLIFLVMYVFSVLVIKKDEKQKYGFYLYSMLFAAAIFCISINMAVLERAAQYFSIISIISLPTIIEDNFKESKLLLNTIVVSLFITYASTIMINKPEWNSAYNYKTCLLPEDGYVCE